jgi:hypothetical protein
MASISAAIGIIGYVNLRAMRRADLALYECDTKPQPDLAHMSVTFQKIRVALRDFLASSSPEQKAKFSQQAIDLTVELDQAVKRSLKWNLSREERALFDQFMRARILCGLRGSHSCRRKF